MNDHSDDNASDFNDGNDDVDCSSKIKDLDREIKEALRVFKKRGKTDAARKDYVRKRNALYSQRKYYKKKLLMNELLGEKNILDQKNAAVRAQNENFEAILAYAREQIRLHERLQFNQDTATHMQLNRQFFMPPLASGDSLPSAGPNSVSLPIARQFEVSKMPSLPNSNTQHAPEQLSDGKNVTTNDQTQRAGVANPTCGLNSPQAENMPIRCAPPGMSGEDPSSVSDSYSNQFREQSVHRSLQQVAHNDQLSMTGQYPAALPPVFAGTGDPYMELMLQRQFLWNQFNRNAMMRDGGTVIRGQDGSRNPTLDPWGRFHQVLPANYLPGETAMPAAPPERTSEEQERKPASKPRPHDTTAVDVLLALHRNQQQQQQQELLLQQQQHQASPAVSTTVPPTDLRQLVQQSSVVSASSAASVTQPSLEGKTDSGTCRIPSTEQKDG